MPQLSALLVGEQVTEAERDRADAEDAVHVDERHVEEIAGRAGVAFGSIYNSFGSKAGLHAAVVDRALNLDREYMDRAYTPDRSPLQLPGGQTDG